MTDLENTEIVPDSEKSAAHSDSAERIPDTTPIKNTNNDFTSFIQTISAESDNLVKLLNTIIEPIVNNKKQEFELKKEEINLEIELSKAKVNGEKSRIRWICIVIILLIIASIFLFIFNILSAETVAFLFGTLAGCLVTFATRNEKIVVVRDEPKEGE